MVTAEITRGLIAGSAMPVPPSASMPDRPPIAVTESAAHPRSHTADRAMLDDAFSDLSDNEQSRSDRLRAQGLQLGYQLRAPDEREERPRER